MKERESHAFMLRLWRESPEEEWRLAIQAIDEPAPRGLASVDALAAYVRAQMEREQPQTSVISRSGQRKPSI